MNDQDNCKLCSIPITEENIGYELKEGLVCNNCYKKRAKEIISNLNHFRKSPEFNVRYKLLQKLLWFSEQMGYWHDSGYSQESVTDYEGYSTHKMQTLFLDQMISVLTDDAIDLASNMECEYDKIRLQFDRLMER